MNHLSATRLLIPLTITLSILPARADWQQITTTAVTQTFQNQTTQATLARNSAVSLSGSGFPISTTVTIMTTPTEVKLLGTFPPPVIDSYSLQVNTIKADPLAPALLNGTLPLSSRQQISIAPNRLTGAILPNGDLSAGAGSSASEVVLQKTNQFSTFP